MQPGDPSEKPEDGQEKKEAEEDDSAQEKIDKKKENFFKNLFSGFFPDAPKGDQGAALEF